MKKLNLGKELSKNDQKKVYGGGVTIYCSNGDVISTPSVTSCETIDEQAYCYYTRNRSSALACYSW